MSQKLLLHLYSKIHDYSLKCIFQPLSQDARERRNESIDAAITITQNINSARDVSRAIREQFDHKSGGQLELTVPGSESDTVTSIPEDIDVQVTIERTVRLDQRSMGYGLENYSRSGRFARETQSRG